MLRKVAEAQRSARARCVDDGWDIKWLSPANLHILLRFVGEISVALPPSIKEALEPRVNTLSPIPLQALGMRGVGDEDHGQSIVIDLIDESEGLALLGQALTEGLEELGFKPPELSDAPPMMIVARVKSAGQTPLEELLAEHAQQDFGHSEASELLLYRSDAHSRRGEFRRLWHITLAGPEAGTAAEDQLTGEEPEEHEAEDG